MQQIILLKEMFSLWAMHRKLAYKIKHYPI
jgi:hypothetical protein